MTSSSNVQIGLAPINGAQLYYETAGTGDPLVFVHAGIADSHMWESQFAEFAQHYRVVRYDMRGFGQSQMVAGPFDHQRDLYELLRFLNIERAYLVGCSRGGANCIDLTLEHPEMVGALILVGSALGGYRYPGGYPQTMIDADEALERGDIEQGNELEIQTWIDGASRTPDQVDPAVRNLVLDMNRIALMMPDIGVEERIDPPAVGRLSEIHTPTLVLIGDLDTPRTLAAADILASSIAGARRATIEGTTHLPNMEKPAEFNQIVMGFLGNIA